MRNIFLYLFFCLSVFPTMAQTDARRTMLDERSSELWKKMAEGNYVNAIGYAEETLKKAEAYFGTKDSFYANTLYGLGLVHNAAGHYKDAEDCFLKAQKLQKEIYGENNIWYVSTVVTLGNVYTSTGRYAEAENTYLRLLPVLKKNFGADNPTYNSTLFSLAALYFYMGKYEESIPYYDEVIENWARLYGKTSSYYATGIGSLAASYQKMDRLEEAEFLTNEALKLHEKTLGKEHPYYATTKASLSTLYRNQKKYAEAENHLLETIGLQKASSGVESEAYLQSLHNLSTLYTETKEYAKAKTQLQEVLKIRAKNQGKNNIKYTDALLNLASIEEQQGNYTLAESQLNESISILQRVSPGTAVYQAALVRLGYFYEQRSAFDKAEQIFLEALELGNRIQAADHSKNIIVLNALAIVYRKTGQPEKAKTYCRKAIVYNCKTDSTALLSDNGLLKIIPELDAKNIGELLTSLKIMVKIAEDSKNLKLAFELNFATIKLIEKIQNSFSLQENKIAVFANTFEFISMGISYAKTLAQTQSDSKYLNSALQLSEKNKSMLLETAMKGQRARSFGDLPQEIALKEEALQKQKNKLEKLRAEALSDSAKTKITYDLNSLNSSIDSFTAMLKKDYPRYYQIKYGHSETAYNFHQLLKKSDLLLEFLVSDDKIYIFAITHSGIRLHSKTIEKKVLSEKVSALRKSLSDYTFIKENQKAAYTLYTESAYWFYENLLKEILKEIDAKHLIIIADGELGHLPFEAFLSEMPKQETAYHNLPYLINKYKISYNFSIALLQENQKIKGKGNGKMLAIAATYKNGDDSLNSSVVRAPHHKALRDELKDLPAAREEVRVLSQLFRGKFIIGEAGSEKAFKKEADQFSVIHLAMHGILNQRAPILSALAFSENGDSTEDNFLEAWEISHLKLNAQLVVLSACETGYGKFQQGEGIISLARSFMFAGSSSVIVSLWQVNDASTSKIMQLFYKNLSKGMDKAEALRQAKLEFIKTSGANANGIYAHPAFWAAFIQLGDSRPLKISKQGNSTLLWIVIFGAALLSIIVYRRYFLSNNKV